MECLFAFFFFFGKSTLTVNFCNVGVQVNVLLNVNQLREFLSIFKLSLTISCNLFKSSSPPKQWISQCCS